MANKKFQGEVEERDRGSKEKAFAPAFWTKDPVFLFCARLCKSGNQPWINQTPPGLWVASSFCLTSISPAPVGGEPAMKEFGKYSLEGSPLGWESDILWMEGEDRSSHHNKGDDLVRPPKKGDREWGECREMWGRDWIYSQSSWFDSPR